MDLDLTLTMPSHPRFLCVARSAINELGSVCGFSESDCRRITLAVDEALANIIRHAYKGRYDQPIEVNCHISADSLEFTLLDQGEPLDPVKIRSAPLDAVSLSGRGTHVMKLIMDEVSYQRVPAGNQLKLRKHLPLTAANSGTE